MTNLSTTSYLSAGHFLLSDAVERHREQRLWVCLKRLVSIQSMEVDVFTADRVILNINWVESKDSPASNAGRLSNHSHSPMGQATSPASVGVVAPFEVIECCQ